MRELINRLSITCSLLFSALMIFGAKLPAQEPSKTANRLAKSASPYLLQHAHNPVDWYPWGSEAFEKARKENKPIFLSVGYSACHWCHVMERESFADPAIARLLNDAFVCVKVDREERPDVDAVYMAALQAFSGGGGWPMNMILMPDGRPFFGMTYLPPRDKEGGEGLETLVKRVKDAWRDNRKELERDAENLSAAARKLASAEGGLNRRGPIRPDLARATLQELSEQFDPNYGGFGSNSRKPKSPKFPEPTNLLFLLDLVENPKLLKDKELTERAREMVLTTMDNIARGGIRDHLGGGIHRYSTDRYWTVPHFEKMLYDNALWISLCARAHALTGDARWKVEADDAAGFLDNEMLQPGGGFSSSLDADTDGQEGLTYLWSKSELESVLKGQPDAELFRTVFALKQAPNFEDRDYILAIFERWPSLTEENKLSEEAIRRKLAPLKKRLVEVRKTRKQPAKDDKRLTSWTGLAIGGLADAGRLTGNKRALELARNAASFLLDKHKQNKRLRHVSRGEVYSGEDPFLEDYAYLIFGLNRLHSATGEAKWLDESKTLAEQMIKLFEDPANGGFYETTADAKELFVRPRNWFDGALPSPAGLATQELLMLAGATADQKFADSARRSIEAASGYFSSAPDAVLSFVRAGMILPAVPDDAELASPPAKKPAKPQPVAVKPATQKPIVIAPGAEVVIELELLIEKGFHTYANPSTAESAKPTEVTLDDLASKPLELVNVDYPAGEVKQIASSGIEPVAIYEGKQVLKAWLRVPRDVPEKEVDGVFVISYQVCTDQYCLPPAKLRVPVKVVVKKP